VTGVTPERDAIRNGRRGLSAEIFIDAASEGASSVEKCCRAIQNLYRTMRISTELWQNFGFVGS
jgi:hypothetical protein